MCGSLMVASFHAACRNVLADCKDDYAKAYAQAGLTLDTCEAIRAQVPYLLCNLSHWRGELAKNTRNVLRSIGRM